MFSFNISVSAGHKSARLEDLRRKVLEYAGLNVSRKSYSAYRITLNNLVKFFDNEKLSHISKTDLQNFIAARKKSICPATGRHYSLFSINIEIAIIKKAFSIALEKKWIQESPARSIKKFRVKSEVPAFDSVQLELFLDAVKSSTKNIHFYYAIQLGLLTGMRKGEIANLKWSQIDFENSRIKLQNKINKEIEYAYFNDAVAAIFNELMSLVNSPQAKGTRIISIEGYVWGRKLNQRNLNHTFNLYRDKLNLPPKLRFHSTRHTAITRWANNLPFHIAQDLARHKDPAMTKRYVHTREEELKQAINLIK